MPKTTYEIIKHFEECAPNCENQRWWSEEEIQIAFNKAIMNCDKKENAINLMYDYLLEKN